MINEQIKKTESNDITTKVGTIIVLVGLLILPQCAVQDQIYSRRSYEQIAQQEVANGWGKDLELGSPSIVYDGKEYFPSQSETVINVATKIKKRGIFKVPVYTVNLKTKTAFTKPQLPKGKKEPPVPSLYIPIKPIEGLQEIKITDVNTGKEIKGSVDPNGVRIDGDAVFSNLEIAVVSRGTGLFSYRSQSEKENIKMAGNWTKPKFFESMLPTDTKLSKDGFEATWTFQSLLNIDAVTRSPKTIGVTNLWIGADYAMIEKAMKYGILFITLTFILVFTVEFISKAKIHFLQYGMIGLSICLFYLLLLAISEEIGFNLAYLISSAATSLLIWFYVGGFLNQKRFVRMILMEQIGLSGFFYVLLSLEERAFLIGSLGLFGALALIMTVTRRLDWYSGNFKKLDQAG